ncbi:MAG: hypothetical protein EHM24_33090, partial [Acidobacteria bacterium]
MSLHFPRALAVVCLCCTGAAQPAVAQTTPATSAKPDVRTLTLASKVFENTRTIRVYLPPGYDSSQAAGTRYPVLYMNDGFAVFAERSWDAPRQLDELIGAGAVRPLILVGIDNAASIPGAKNP